MWIGFDVLFDYACTTVSAIMMHVCIDVMDVDWFMDAHAMLSYMRAYEIVSLVMSFSCVN